MVAGVVSEGGCDVQIQPEALLTVVMLIQLFPLVWAVVMVLVRYYSTFAECCELICERVRRKQDPPGFEASQSSQAQSRSFA